MRINDISIEYYFINSLRTAENGAVHQKMLPFLSIVQALDGDYGISLDGGTEQHTGTGGAFIAPAHTVQRITHNVNPKTKHIESHWIFLDVRINHIYRLEDIFTFPLLLPSQWNHTIQDIIQDIAHQNDLCDTYIRIYQLIKILIEIGVPKEPRNEQVDRIMKYLELHYREKLHIKDLAAVFHLSEATLYRIFKKATGGSPYQYLCRYRISKAAALLESSNLNVSEIAQEVGIDDPFYFCKIFKEHFGSSPSHYKKLLRMSSRNEQPD